MDISFKGLRALVTGAGKGIGRDTVKQLVLLGAETVAVSRTASDLDSLKTEVPGIITFAVDLGDWDATRTVLQNVGPIDLLVNNAGVSIGNNFLDVTQEDFDQELNVNYKALFNVSQVICKGMVERGKGGAVVNVSSAASTMAYKGHGTYCVTKAAVDMLTKVMALELGPHQIRVNAVNPTVAMTVMGRQSWSDRAKSEPLLKRIPLGRFLEVSEIVDAMMYLLSDKAAMVHGITLPIEGGLLTN